MDLTLRLKTEGNASSDPPSVTPSGSAACTCKRLGLRLPRWSERGWASQPLNNRYVGNAATLTHGLETVA
jgi:hypothetical protein